MNFMEIWPILAFLTVQTVAAVWWAATQTQRINQLEKDATNHSGHGESIARFEEAFVRLEKQLEELLRELRLPNRRRT
jgi:hypothetical protein